MNRIKLFVIVLLVCLSSVCLSDYCRLLIVCHEDFIDHIDDFVEWKYETGWKPLVLEITSDMDDLYTIHDEIVAFIDELDTIPEYMLIIGDNTHIPIGYHNRASTDAFYAEFDTTDENINSSIARFPAADIPELRNIISKTMHYAQNPESDGDYTWIKRAGLFHDTHNPHYPAIMDTIENVLAGYSYTINRYRGADAPSSEIIEEINNGYGYMIFRGEGVDHWGSFFFLEPEDVDNECRTPVISGTTCSSLRSFGPRWLTVGSAVDPQGAVIYIGTGTTSAGTDLMMQRSAMADGFLYGFLSGMTSGQAVSNGRQYVIDYGGSWSYTEYSSMYIMGDPTIWVWTEIPQEITVSYPSNFIPGESELDITVSSSGTPIENAQCCITMDDYIYEVGFTNSDGVTTLEYSCPEDCIDSILISVVGHNILPFRAYINRLYETPRPYITETWLDDTRIGNGDSLLSRNETCNVKYKIANAGETPTDELTVILRSESPFVEITDSISEVRALVSHEEIEVSDDFELTVSGDARVGETILFELEIRTTGHEYYSEWISPEIVGGSITIPSFTIIDDSPWGNGNSLLNSQETALIEFPIANIGSAHIENISIEFSSLSEDIILDNFIHNISLLEIDEIDTLTPMQIHCIAICDGYESAEIMFELTAYESGINRFTETDTLTIEFSGYMSEINGADEYGYYIYDYKDTQVLQCPEYEWLDISEIGIRNTRLSEAIHAIEQVTMPFEFQFYGENFDLISISSEGCILGGFVTYTYSYPDQLPISGYYYSSVGAAWADLNTDISGDVYTYYDVHNGKYYIQFDNVLDIEHNYVSFQLVITDESVYPTPTDDNEIYIYYPDSLPDGNKVVGIQNSSGLIGMTYLGNSRNYAPGASELTDESAIRITTIPPTFIYNDISISISEIEITELYGDEDMIFEEGESLAVEIEIANTGSINAENIRINLLNLDDEVVFGITPDTLTLEALTVDETYRFTQTLSFEIIYALIEKNAILGLEICSNDGEYAANHPYSIPIRFNTNIEESFIPNDLEIVNAYPNPFNSTINFELPSDRSIIEIYSTNGKLLERHTPGASIYKLDWHSSEYSTGVYLYKVITYNKEQSGKVVYIK